MNSLLQWFGHWEPIWLFLILHTEALIGFITLVIIILDYIRNRSDGKKIAAMNKTLKKLVRKGKR